MTTYTLVAATITVDDDPGADYTSIQQAVDSANSGDTIVVNPGTYTENVKVNKSVIIISQFGNPDDTHVQAANSNDHVFHVTVDNVTISGFNVTGATNDSYAGMYLDEVQHNNISFNKLSNNWHGIWLNDSSNNTLNNNTVCNNPLSGIVLEAGTHSSGSSNNTLIGNIVCNNTLYGIMFEDDSNNNTIYNNIFNNTNNTQISADSTGNIWNTTKTEDTNIIDGPFLGGNYWATPEGTGFSQTCIDADLDGICDLQFNIDGNNIDYLPLSTITMPDVTAPEVTANNPIDLWVNNGTMLHLNATITDIGSEIKNATVNVSGINSTITTAILIKTADNYWINDSIIVDTSNFGLQNLSIISYDNANNVNNTENFTVKVDNIPPVIHSAYASPSVIEANGADNASLRVTAADIGSGIASVTIDLSAIGGLPAQDMINDSGVWQYNIKTTKLGTFHLPVNVTDNVGFSNTSVNITLTTIETEPSDGGAGSAGSEEPQINIELRELISQYVFKDIHVKYNFEDDANSIMYIEFDPKINAGKITAIIEILKGRSASVRTLPPDEVYQNVNIWVGSVGFAIPEKIENAVVGFKVEKSWITENEIDESTIRLNRHYDNRWNPLPTVKIDEDDIYVYFESQTPGFSPFAITGQKYKMEEEEEVKVLEEEVTGEEEITEENMTEEEPEAKAPGFEAILTISGLLVVAFFIFRRKQ